jgi:predicted transcriptional regulator/ribosome-associated translation inhibitor RaiA
MVKIKELIKKDFPKLEEDEYISKAFPMMKDSEALIVLKDGKYRGILNKRDISRAKISPKTKAKTFLKNVAKVSEDEELETTAALMLESDAYLLPVFEKDKIVGVITAENLLKKAVEEEYGEEIIKNYISTPVININSDEPVSKAIKIFKEEDISRLPVYENNKLSGIITLDDTISKFIQSEHRQGGSGQYEDTSKFGAYMADKTEYLDLPIKGIMNESVSIMSPEKNVREIVNTMIKRKYRGVLIGEDHNVSGIVTKRDLLEPLATYTITEPIVIQFSGELEKISEFNKQRPKEIIYNNFKKHLDYLDNAYVYVRLKRHTEQSKGKHIIFCKMRLSSPRGMFIASEEGWGFMDAVNKSCEAIEKQIRRNKPEKR